MDFTQFQCLIDQLKVNTHPAVDWLALRPLSKHPFVDSALRCIGVYATNADFVPKNQPLFMLLTSICV